MSFHDENSAMRFLSNVSYYRLKGYWWEMQDDKVAHHFVEGTYFEDVIARYNFDKRFRLIVFAAIEQIEIALRTKMIYHLSLVYGAKWHLKPSLFVNEKHFSDFLNDVNTALRNSSEEFIKKHYENHADEAPESWKALEIISFGVLSKLYQNLGHQLPEKNKIAYELGLYNQKHLVSWLKTITLIRNIIAHHGRLWNRVIINNYSWPNNSIQTILDYRPNDFQRRKIFPILSAILYMNNFISPEHHIKAELLALFAKFKEIPLFKMGFPKGWEQQSLWRMPIA